MKTFIVEGNGWERTIDIDESLYEKYGDMGMEAMTRAVEDVMKGEGKPTYQHGGTTYPNFGFIVLAYEDGYKGDDQKTLACLTEIVLRNAGYHELAERARQEARRMIIENNREQD